MAHKPHIGIVGRAKSGKSTVAGMLLESGGYHKHALADPLKLGLGWLASAILGFIPDDFVPPRVAILQEGLLGRTGESGNILHRGLSERHGISMAIQREYIDFVNENKDAFRPALQYFGTEVIRNLATAYGEDTVPWVRILLRETRTSEHLGMGTVCDDIRFPDEVEHLRKAGFRIVRIVRPGQEEGAPAHASESFWETLDVDDEIVNDDTLDMLARKVRLLDVGVTLL